MYTKKIVVRIQRNMNVIWHPSDVIRPVLLPHIRFNRVMVLVKDNTPRHAVRSTHVIQVNKQTSKTPMACTKYGLKSEQARVGHWSAMCLHSQPLRPNLSELTRVTHQMCHSTTVSSQIHYVIGNNVGTMYSAVIATAIRLILILQVLF